MNMYQESAQNMVSKQRYNRFSLYLQIRAHRRILKNFYGFGFPTPENLKKFRLDIWSNRWGVLYYRKGLWMCFLIK